jgi:hypothetical protein
MWEFGSADGAAAGAFLYGSILACVGLVFGPLLACRWWPREKLRVKFNKPLQRSAWRRR